MKLISWNMNQREQAWRHLATLMTEHGVLAALVQEAVAPPPEVASDLLVFGDPSLGDEPWRMPIPSGARRRFASAIAIRTDHPVELCRPQPIQEAAYGALAISHPGQWVAARIGAPPELICVVSLYGMWDRMADTGDIYAEASLHRAISDLTPLLQEKAATRMVIAGDLNIWRGYGGKPWADRYKTVFDRLVAYGLELAGPFRVEGAPLDGCPCAGGDDCTHVRTYRHQRKPTSRPYQNDYMFARGVRIVRCVALDDDASWAQSDHCPVLIEVELV